MEEKINDILENSISIYNQMKVLNDSLMLSFQNDKDNYYQYACAEIILDNLDKVCEKLENLDCEVCALQSEKNTRQ